MYIHNVVISSCGFPTLICLCGKITILTVDKLAISGAMYLAKYFSYLSMKTFFYERYASMEVSAISVKGGNLYHFG